MNGKNPNKKELRESEELFRITFEQAAVGIAHVKPNGRFIRVNQKFCDILKYPKEELLSIAFQEITHPDDLNDNILSLRSMLNGDLKIYSTEKRYKRKDLSYVWVNLTVSLVKNASNKPKYFIAFVEDISNRKLMENAFAESESRYKNIVENTTDVIIVTGFDGKHMYVSPRYKELFGRTPEEIDKFLLDYLHPEDRPKLIELYKKSFLEKYAAAPDTEFEFRIQHQDGHYIWVSSITKSYYDEEGKISGVITSLRDIRKRKETEKKLMKSELQYKNIIENTTDVIIVTNFDGKHIYVSPLYESLTGWTIDVLDKLPIEYIHPEDRPNLIESYVASFKNRYTVRPHEELEHRILLKNGSYLWVSSVTNNYLDENGKIIGLITSMRDINKRKEAEKKVIESEKKYRHLFESSPYIIGLINESGTVIDCNSSISNFFLMQKKDIIGKTIFEIFSTVEENKNLIPIFQNIIKDIFSENRSKSDEFSLYRSSGGFLWLNIEGSIIEINNQNLIQFIIQDITERKKIEENLKESEIKFRTIAEQSFMGIIIIQDGVFKYFNQRAADINGYTVEEINNWGPYNFMKLIHPDDNDFVLDQVKKKQKGDKNVVNHYKYRIIKKSGEVAWLDNYSKTITFNGRYADLVMTEDITEKILSEQQLKESELKFRKVFEANPSAMHLYDLNLDGELIFKGANPAADKILNINNKQYIGKTFEEAFPPLWKTDLPSKYKIVALEGETLNWKYYSKIDEQIDKIYEIYAFQTVPGSIVASFLDITARIEAENRLKEMNNLKSELLRRASHEFKTPLTSINGATDLLLTTYNNNFDEKILQFLNIIKNGGKRLENLIEDLLDVSKLQKQHIKLEKEKEDIVKLILDSIQEIEFFASERDINIYFNQEESIFLDIDKNKILQVFINILRNAIKNTPHKGEVLIKINQSSENFIDILFRDTGIGFIEKEMANLFTQFGKIERYGQGMDVDTEGSGLGLYISKELIELHSGELLVKSDGRNKGSTFIIRLPK